MARSRKKIATFNATNKTSKTFRKQSHQKVRQAEKRTLKALERGELDPEEVNFLEHEKIEPKDGQLEGPLYSKEELYKAWMK